MRGGGASAALLAGPLGGPRRSSRLPSPANTRPLGAASVWRRVLSCDVATLRRVMASSLTGASAAHWAAASTSLGIVAGAVLAMQGCCRCLQLPARVMPRILWGRSGVHQPTWRLRLLEWKRGLSAACDHSLTRDTNHDHADHGRRNGVFINDRKPQYSARIINPRGTASLMKTGSQSAKLGSTRLNVRSARWI